MSDYGLEALYEKMRVEDDLYLMQSLCEIRNNITYWNIRYHMRIKEKNHHMSDQINLIIRMLEEELDHVSAAVRNNACEVHPASNGGNKKVFILER